MIAVIFELQPGTDKQSLYLEQSALLRPMLDQISGFISVERFESLTTPGKLLSLSFWEDELSIAQWRNLEARRKAQSKGRQSLFEGYRMRVATVVRDYGMHSREQAPQDSIRIHDHVIESCGLKSDKQH